MGEALREQSGRSRLPYASHPGAAPRRLTWCHLLEVPGKALAAFILTPAFIHATNKWRAGEQSASRGRLTVAGPPAGHRPPRVRCGHCWEAGVAGAEGVPGARLGASWFRSDGLAQPSVESQPALGARPPDPQRLPGNRPPPRHSSPACRRPRACTPPTAILLSSLLAL